MDCGHGGTCYECALELWKTSGECYLCRNLIKQVLQIDINNINEGYYKVITATQKIKDN